MPTKAFSATSDREQIRPAKPPTWSEVLVTVPNARTPSTRPPAMLPNSPAQDAVASTTKFEMQPLLP